MSLADYTINEYLDVNARYFNDQFWVNSKINRRPSFQEMTVFQLSLLHHPLLKSPGSIPSASTLL